MSGTRFARSGRCRFFICLGVMVLMFGVIAIFHSSQQQLDKTREQRLRCEQQQEALNEQLQSVVEEKYKLKKNHENELNEQLDSQRSLEQKLKDVKDALEKNQVDERARYEKLQQAHKTLQSKHNELLNNYNKSKTQHLEEHSGFEKKLESMQEQLENEKKGHNDEISSWRNKYNGIVQEKERLEGLLNAADAKGQLQQLVTELERTLFDYQAHCTYRPLQSPAQHSNNPLKPPDIQSLNKPRTQKSFDREAVVSPGLYHIAIKTTNITRNLNISSTNHVKSTQQSVKNVNGPSSNGGDGENDASNGNKVNATVTLNQLPLIPQRLLSFSERNNHSLILNSVENFQILPKPIKKVFGEIESQLKHQPEDNKGRLVLPLSAPRKSTSTEASKSKQHLLEANAHLKPALNSSTSSSSTSLPPLAQPPNQRKLPENVAPIPANFEELLQHQDPLNRKDLDKIVNNGDGVDNDAAEEDLQKNENDDGNNNRYANVVNEMENKAHKPDANDDSGAHEVKDQDFMNDQNFNLPPEDDNFFDGGKNDGPNVDKQKHDDSEDDMVGVIGAGDIAVKNHNQLLDENLNNEVAADQGKELPDGLHLEEANDEDGDEDDYSNPAARQQGAQAIRN